MAQSTPERTSRRRTLAQHGFIRFPVDNPALRSTGEGGMFVKLVVVDNREYDESDWNICCGAVITDLLSETLVGDDQAKTPRLVLSAENTPEQTLADMRAHDAAYKAWQSRHFPFIQDESMDCELRCLSRPYVATMLLGITGWSGFDDARDEYWRCTRQDLSEQGIALLN